MTVGEKEFWILSRESELKYHLECSIYMKSLPIGVDFRCVWLLFCKANSSSEEVIDRLKDLIIGGFSLKVQILDSLGIIKMNDLIGNRIHVVTFVINF